MSIYMWREPKYLCFTANTAGSTVKLNKVGSPVSVTLETSTDGINWSTYTFGNTITLSNVGSKVYWRNTSTSTTAFSTSMSHYYKFVMTGSINGSGEVNYLLNKNSTNVLTGDHCFLLLFSECSSLKTPPELTATTLMNYCYQYMFDHCGLTNSVPSLPCTEIAVGCYAGMFNACSSMTSIPKLPATTLKNFCYQGMFAYCSNIKISNTQGGIYQNQYRIPYEGTGTTATSALENMIFNTGGTITGTPTINTTYYTSNTVV